MKPIDVKSNTNIDLDVENNEKDPKFKVAEYQNLRIFLLDVTLNKLKIRWTYIIEDINGEKIARTFYEKELQKTNQTEFRIEKVTKKWKRLR